ncbi:MAG: bifunctional homocysteine S-methyltransferase/methylenetetrahydrofolate reductase, partial [Gemmatimonadales bacterium]|nr:bifunctional homocysteine S-methyltransferase/methylenetetrahydrofolate reductase [Gemmatimonadales bacterium]
SDPDKELARFAWKVDAGAEFAVTQPVFEPELLEAFLDGVGGPSIPLIAGIWPLTSLRSAEFLENEVPGIHVPQSIIERMRRAQDRSIDAARAEGVAIAREVFQAVRGFVQGVHINAPFGRVEPVQAVLREISGQASQ